MTTAEYEATECVARVAKEEVSLMKTPTGTTSILPIATVNHEMQGFEGLPGMRSFRLGRIQNACTR